MNHLGPSVSRTRLLACMVFAASLCGCAGGTDRPTQNAPEKVADGWPVASPEAFGADIEQLAAMVDRIEAGDPRA